MLLGFVYLDQTYDQRGVMNINGCIFLLQTQMTMSYVMAVINVSSLFWLLHVGLYNNSSFVDLLKVIRNMADFEQLVNFTNIIANADFSYSVILHYVQLLVLSENK